MGEAEDRGIVGHGTLTALQAAVACAFDEFCHGGKTGDEAAGQVERLVGAMLGDLADRGRQKALLAARAEQIGLVDSRGRRRGRKSREEKQADEAEGRLPLWRTLEFRRVQTTVVDLETVGIDAARGRGVS